jgi:hypothetical protein
MRLAHSLSHCAANFISEACFYGSCATVLTLDCAAQTLRNQ